MKSFLLIMLLCLTMMRGYSQEINISSDTSKIEQQLRDDLTNSQGDMQEAISIGTAIESYDKLLNKYYNACLKKLAGSQKTNLIEAQKAWIVFRNKEGKYIDKKYTGGPGLNLALMSSEKLHLLTNRVIELYQHWEMAL